MTIPTPIYDQLVRDLAQAAAQAPATDAATAATITRPDLPIRRQPRKNKKRKKRPT